MNDESLVAPRVEGNKNAPPTGLRIILMNSAANLVRALSGSLVTLVLPLILLWVLSHEAYGIWAIVFSLSSYVIYLDLGLQASLQATVARLAGLGQNFLATRMAFAGVLMAGVIGVIALAGAALGAVNLHELFPDMARSRLADAGIALVVLSLGQVANLLMNVIASYFAGHQRSAFPALMVSIARVVALLLVGSCSWFAANLVVLAIAFSAPLIAALAILLVSFIREASGLRRGAPDVADTTSILSLALQLLRHSGPLMVWNVCVLVVGAAGTAIVARIDFDAVVLYSFSTMFVLAVVGIDNAVLAPMLSELSRLTSVASRAALAAMIASVTRINAVILSSLGVGCWSICAVLTLSGYFGADPSRGTLVIAGLVFAGIIRLMMTPMTMGFIATESHRRVVIQPVIEAGLCLGASVVLGVHFGVVGVVLGGVLSALVGVALAITWSRKSSGLGVSLSARTVLTNVLIPLICMLPALAGAVFVAAAKLHFTVGSIALIVLCAVVSGVLLWRFGLLSVTRQLLTDRLPQRFR